MRVLVADDAAPLRALFARIVRGLGHQVIAEAADANTLLRLAAEAGADVVVIDGRLGPEGALPLVARVRAMLPEAAIFVVASLAETALVRRAASAGATGIFARPFRVDQVAAGLARCTVP